VGYGKGILNRRRKNENGDSGIILHKLFIESSSTAMVQDDIGEGNTEMYMRKEGGQMKMKNGRDYGRI
jgi:hypothetical protein